MGNDLMRFAQKKKFQPRTVCALIEIAIKVYDLVFNILYYNL